jgi:hypothetical protein
LENIAFTPLNNSAPLLYVAYIITRRKPEGKRPLERSRSRWEVRNRMDLREIVMIL